MFKFKKFRYKSLSIEVDSKKEISCSWLKKKKNLAAVLLVKFD